MADLVSKAVYKGLGAYRRQLRRWERQAAKPITAGIRKIMREARKRSARQLTARGIGRRIWGSEIRSSGVIPRTSSLGAQLASRRVRRRGDRYTGGLTLTGIARLAEEGGRTKAHLIPKRAAPGRLVAFAWDRVRGPAVFRQVKHPGGSVGYARGYATRALQLEGRQGRRYIEEAVVRSMRREFKL